MPLGRLHLIDSSTISLCVSMYRWAESRETKGGIRLHWRLRVHDDFGIPEKMIMTPAKLADRTQMDALVLIEKKDAIVFLGKNNQRMKHLLRLIETEDTEGNPIRIITDVTDLSAEKITDAYRYRWKIKLFFKWLKQHLEVKHFFGTTNQAVENQLYIALITFLMLTKLKGDSGSLLEFTRMLLDRPHGSFSDFLAKLLKKPPRSSRGRRVLNHDLIFKHTYEQAMAENIDFLYDTTYDPIIL